ncbi:hypothetical protein AX14_006501 [Amanita brunnescens Koide BX004]|nr:hypothetical protein AX14_006501 [Amanita brunnescens Koide BX004]
MSASEYKQLIKDDRSATKKSTKAKAYNPEVEEGRVDDSTHFLGRALACVILPNLGGEGPEMKSPPLQRELVPAQVKKLLDIAGQTGKGLLRLIPEHEIIIGISGKAINVESLSHDSRGPFETVELGLGLAHITPALARV